MANRDPGKARTFQRTPPQPPRRSCQDPQCWGQKIIHSGVRLVITKHLCCGGPALDPETGRPQTWLPTLRTQPNKASPDLLRASPDLERVSLGLPRPHCLFGLHSCRPLGAVLQPSALSAPRGPCVYLLRGLVCAVLFALKTFPDTLPDQLLLVFQDSA